MFSGFNTHNDGVFMAYAKHQAYLIDLLAKAERIPGADINLSEVRLRLQSILDANYASRPSAEYLMSESFLDLKDSRVDKINNFPKLLNTITNSDFSSNSFKWLLSKTISSSEGIVKNCRLHPDSDPMIRLFGDAYAIKFFYEMIKK